MEIKSCTIADLTNSQNLKELLSEYSAESSIDGLPYPNPSPEIYNFLEQSNGIHFFGAFEDDKLLGFISILSPVMPHYGVKVSVTESFFVAKEYRKTGAGLKLLHMAEEQAKLNGSYGLLVSSNVGSTLDKVLSGLEFKKTNHIYFKGFV